MVQEEDHEQGRGHHRAEEADRYRLNQRSLTPVGLRTHVGDRERSTDAQDEPEWERYLRARLGEALAPTFSALRLLVEPLRVGGLLARAVGFGGRKLVAHLVDP